MRLPGFTAEDSLRWNVTAYKVAGSHGGVAVDGAVLPQFFMCHGEVCCNEYGYCIHKGHVLM